MKSQDRMGQFCRKQLSQFFGVVINGGFAADELVVMAQFFGPITRNAAKEPIVNEAGHLRPDDVFVSE